MRNGRSLGTQRDWCCQKGRSTADEEALMQIHSGYKTITPIQLANALWALDQGQIDQRALRVHLACFALVAVREAAQRYRRKRRERPRECHRYRLGELERLTGLAPATVRRALRQLERAELMRFTEGEVTLRRETLPGSEELQDALDTPWMPDELATLSDQYGQRKGGRERSREEYQRGKERRSVIPPKKRGRRGR